MFGRRASRNEKSKDSDWVELYDRDSIDGHISAIEAESVLSYAFVTRTNKLDGYVRHVDGGEVIVVNMIGFSSIENDHAFAVRYGVNNIRFLNSWGIEKDIVYARLYLNDTKANPIPGTERELTEAELSDRELFREAVMDWKYSMTRFYIAIDKSGHDIGHGKFHSQDKAIEWAKGKKNAVALLLETRDGVELVWSVPGFTGTENVKPRSRSAGKPKAKPRTSSKPKAKKPATASRSTKPAAKKTNAKTKSKAKPKRR